MVSGSSLNQPLHIHANGVFVQNLTSQWVQIAESGFIPPNTSGSMALGGTAVAVAKFAPPPGVVQPTAVAAQTCLLTYVEAPLPFVAGPTQVSVTQSVTLPPSSIFSAFAQMRARSDAGGDAVISINTTIDQPVKVYRDLTINAGIVLTAGFRLQIVVCRNLTFGNAASRLTATGLGYAGGAAGNGAAGGDGGSFDGVLPGGTDLYRSVFQNGGAFTVALGGAGNPGAAAQVARLLSYLAQIGSTTFPFGAIAGGGGSGGGNLNNVAGTGGTGISGGGAGGTGNNGAGAAGAGANGGGTIVVICSDIKTAAGLIDADGVNASDGTANTGGGGGGGGGLALVMVLAAPTITPVMRANGGTGGTGTGAGAAGGAGLSALFILS